MSEKTVTAVISHIKASSYVDEQVDKFDAFSIAWNGSEAIHLTFGRNTVNVKNTKFFIQDGVSSVESGDMDVIRLDVAGLTIPLETARELASTLAAMVQHADARELLGDRE
jgi:hypothetical protein